MKQSRAPALPRLLCQPIAALTEGKPVCLVGRILYIDDYRLTIADESGALEIRMPQGFSKEAASVAGDIVRIQGTIINKAIEPSRIDVLTPYRRAVPFPSPGCEFYRLHSGIKPRAEMLRFRARCLAAIRAFFDEQGYIEVQTPLRVNSPGLEPHLVAEKADPGYLITSPEYHMKRLLVGGLEKIYFLGPCWRGEEQGAHHLSEFTMLEWYQAFFSIEELMRQTEDLLSFVAEKVCGTTKTCFCGCKIDLTPPFERMTVKEACLLYAGVQIPYENDVEGLKTAAEKAGFGPFAREESFEAIISEILVDKVEPALVKSKPVFLYEYPAPMAALSRIKADDSSVAERFEVYAGGLELANAFGELNDAEEQRTRFLEDQKARRRMGKPVYALDEKFLLALQEGMPPAAGIALGVDRLVMLLSGAEDIREVVAFANEEI